MPEPQPSTAPPYPSYQQNMWDPRNTVYQREEPLQSESRARGWDSTGYSAPARPLEVNVLESPVAPFSAPNGPNQQAPLNDVNQNRTEIQRDRPNQYRPPASAREHRPPLSQPTQPYNPERAHPRISAQFRWVNAEIKVHPFLPRHRLRRYTRSSANTSASIHL